MSDAQPRLRDDLSITLLTGEEKGYVIEDPLRNLFFKIGRREYLFLCSLNRGDDLSTLPDDTDSDNYSEETVTKEEAVTILKWLAGRQLLQNQDTTTLEAIESAELSAKKKNWLAKLNIISFRIPLFNPDSFLSRIAPWLSWITGPIFFAIWLLFAVVALGTLFVNWNSFTSQTAGFFSSSNIVILSLVWILLKILHELSHALSCHRYGGQVNEMGILFILFIPLTYVNASSSWTFPSRWQRIHVALAGMYIELFVAWIAILYWATHLGTAGALLAHNTVLVAGVSSILFNANPLMRFDGYYVLSDIVQIPNLYFHGLTAVRRRVKKFWLGIVEPGEEQSAFVKAYGIGLNIWRILILFSLGYLAAGLFSGWGLLITIAAATGWIVQPLLAFVERIPAYKEQNPKVVSHFLIRLAAVGLIGGFVLFGISWEKNINVPGVVLFDEQYTVRTVSEGFVDHIFVKEGDIVKQGQLLLELMNEEIVSSSRELALQLEILNLKRRQAISIGTHSELQILDQQRKVLQKRKANLDADIKGLKIYAPGVGKLVGNGLESLQGTWVHKGAELAQVVSPRNKHLVASIGQDDISSFIGRVGEEVVVDMRDRGLGRFSGRIEKVAPVALLELPHPSLAGIYGGPFDVKPAPGRKQEHAFVLFSPRFSVTIQLPDEVKQKLRSGQQAQVQIKGISKTPGHIIWKFLLTWFLHRENPQA